MSEQIDWSKAPEGAIGHGNIGISNFYVWFSDKWYEYVNSNHGGRHYFGDTCVYREKDIVSCTPRPTTPSWSGEGLPPAGVECEFKSPSSGGWSKARIVFVSAWTIVIYVFFEHDEHCYSVSAFEKGNLKFRPIRTPEQIAADEREAAIGEMVQAIYLARCSLDCTPLSPADEAKCASAALYEAGYRKP